GLTLGVPAKAEPDETAEEMRAGEDLQPNDAVEETPDTVDTTDAAEETPVADALPPVVDDQESRPGEETREPVALTSETETSVTQDQPEGADEFRGEVPALHLESNPLASFSEKIIQLEERRAKGRDGLSQSEQNAFREIGRQLEPFGKRPNEVLLNR